MSATSTVAARCAAMGSGIMQVIADANSFGRKLRTSRHDMSAVSADLLAIKLFLDIARDDFSMVGSTYPELLVESAAGFLDCCSAATGSLHKHVIRLSVRDLREDEWQSIRQEDFPSLRQDLAALRSALDLMLDLIASLREITSDSSSRASRSTLASWSSSAEGSLLHRIDVERGHMEELTEGRLIDLYEPFTQLRSCAAILLEERTGYKETRKPLDCRSDSLDPSSGDSSRHLQPSNMTITSQSSNGIGTWIANVISTIEKSSPVPVRARRKPVSRDQESAADSQNGSIPSRGTFYTESSSSGKQTVSSMATGRVQGWTNSNASATSKGAASGLRTATRIIVPSLLSSEQPSITQQDIVVDKIAAAKDKRRQLTLNQKAATDWDLRNINCNTSCSELEQIMCNGADPDVTDHDFGSLLLRAAYELPTELLKLLIDYGSDISKTYPVYLYSPLHAAVLGKQLNNLQYLVERGMAFDTCNVDGDTPLHLAVKTPGAYDVAKWLLEAGADVNQTSRDHGTPLSMALAAGTLDAGERSKMVQLLLAHGAEGEAVDQMISRRRKGLSVLGII